MIWWIGLFAFAGAPVFAQDWKVESLKGTVFWGAAEDSETKPVRLGQVLNEGSTIATEPGARVELRQGTTSVKLGGKTKIKLKSGEQTKASLINMVYGRVRAQVEPEKGQHFRIETNTAVSGVRGTEFFVSADDDENFFCTLHGLVEVESKLNGQKTLVPAKAGVRIAAGGNLNVDPTPESLIAVWKNQTDSERAEMVVSDSYLQSEIKYRPLGRHLYYGLRLHSNLGAFEHIHYSAARADSPSLRFLQARVSPALRVGDRFQLNWIPRWLLHFGNQEQVLDADPALARYSVDRLDIGELYGEGRFGETVARVGLQNFRWNDGVYFSNNFWQLDPYLFPAFRALSRWDRHFIDVVAIRQGETGRLNGQVAADILALKYDFSTWLSVYGGHRDYTRTVASEPSVSRGHRVDDIGFFSRQRVGPLEYKASGLLQKGVLFQGVAGRETPQSARMLDFELAGYPLKGRPLRVALGYLEASENFLPGFESPYNLGYSQIFSRTNLRQYRPKLTYGSFEGEWSASLEWIRSHSVGSGRLSNWAGRDVQLMDEVNLNWNQRWGTHWQTLATGIWMNPSAAMSASSATWSGRAGLGALLNVQYVY